MKTSLLLLALVAALFRSAFAQDPRFPGRVDKFQVRVVADHADWNYAPGEPVKFSITVTGPDKSPVANAPVSYTLAFA